MVRWTEHYKALMKDLENNGKYIPRKDFTLLEVNEGASKQRVIVSEQAGVLTIDAEGYGNCTGESVCNPIVGLKLADGKLQLLVFGDINSEEPTHTISLAGALEAKRKP